MLTNIVKLQERALRTVFNDFSSSCVRKGQYSFSLLSSSFLRTEMYICIKEWNVTYLNDLYTVQASDYQLRDPSRLIQPNSIPLNLVSNLWSIRCQIVECFTFWYSALAMLLNALEKKMLWLFHSCFTIYLKWCRLCSDFIPFFSFISARSYLWK